MVAGVERLFLNSRITAYLLTIVLLCPIWAEAHETAVTLQLKWKHAFQFAGYYMALEKGYYRQAGLNLSIIEGGPGRSPVAHVLSRPAAYGVASTGALLARSQGKPIRALGAIFQHSPLALMVLQRSGIRQLSDLRGKRIMLQHGELDADILASLRQVGLSAQDYRRQETNYRLDSLLSGACDAFSVYVTDQPYQLDAKHLPYRLFRPTDQGIDFYGDIVITSDDEVRHHPERVKAFMAATRRGWHDALTHPEEAIDLILLKYNSQHFSRRKLRFEADASAKLIMADVVDIGYMNRFRWQKIAQSYAALGMLPAAFPVDDFLYQPAPSLGELITTYRWPLLIGFLLLVLLVAAITILLLRRTVRQRTHRLIESERQMRDMVEMADVGIVIHRDGRFLYANPFMLSRMQIDSLTSIRGQEIWPFVHPDDRQLVEQRIDDVIHNDAVYHRQPLRYINTAGETYEVEVGSRAIQIDGQAAVLVIAVDVTERNRASEEKLAMQRQMEHTQRLESLGVLAGGIAHDFNNILAAILGNAALAERQLHKGSHDTLPRYLSNIVHSSEQATALCRQMLAYAGKGSLEVEQLDLSRMVERIAKLLTVSIHKGVTLHYELAKSLPAVEADATQLQQVLMNLVMNASDAMDAQGGEIRLRTGVVDIDASDAPLNVLHEPVAAGRYVFVEVADNGCGMDQATRAKIFEPFFTTKTDGHGLGMSAVLGIVRSHHGAILLDSTVGEGSSFRILLPALAQQVAVAQQDHAQEDDAIATWHASGTVLLIDDEQPVREAASMMLQEIGFDVRCANDGEAGVACYTAHQAEIVAVLLDMSMPNMDGAACFAALKQIDPQVRVILSSGYHEAEAAARMNTEGLAAFIQKPYHPDTLRRVMYQVVSTC